MDWLKLLVTSILASIQNKGPTIQVSQDLDDPPKTEQDPPTWTLHRLQSGSDGIFSELQTPQGQHFCFCAEHAYDGAPKLVDGSYNVLLGSHTLDHGGPQQLYCVQNVPGHEGICFHKGNFPQKDSDGCVLLGQEIETIEGVRGVSASSDTFDKFIMTMAGATSFQLKVTSSSS